MVTNVVFPDVTGFLSSSRNKEHQNVFLSDKSLLRVRGLATVQAEFDEVDAELKGLEFTALQFRTHANNLINQIGSNQYRTDMRWNKLIRYKSLNKGVAPKYPRFIWLLRDGRTNVDFNFMWGQMVELGYGFEDLWIYLAIEHQLIAFERRVSEVKNAYCELGFELLHLKSLPKIGGTPVWVEVV